MKVFSIVIRTFCIYSIYILYILTEFSIRQHVTPCENVNFHSNTIILAGILYCGMHIFATSEVPLTVKHMQLQPYLLHSANLAFLLTHPASLSAYRGTFFSLSYLDTKIIHKLPSQETNIALKSLSFLYLLRFVCTSHFSYISGMSR